MNPQVSVITFGVRDPNWAKQVYNEGLGCAIEQAQGEFVRFSLCDGSSALAHYRGMRCPMTLGSLRRRRFSRLHALVLAGSAESVDAVLAAAVRAGGEIAKPARRASWSGYSGYFTDPDGFSGKSRQARDVSRMASPRCRLTFAARARGPGRAGLPWPSPGALARR
jgi:uncharacterized protein